MTRNDLAEVIHRAICDDSPEECSEWGGDCVKAADAIVAVEAQQ